MKVFRGKDTLYFVSNNLFELRSILSSLAEGGAVAFKDNEKLYVLEDVSLIEAIVRVKGKEILLKGEEKCQ